MNIKDLTSDNSHYENYRDLDAKILTNWTLDEYLISNSTWLTYYKDKDSLDLIQLGKKSSDRAKRLVIYNPSNSSSLSQIIKQESPLMTIKGESILNAIREAEKDHKLDIHRKNSNSNVAYMSILKNKEQGGKDK